MKQKCYICGCEADEYWMESFNHGRKTVWLCWDCYKNSQREATLSDIYRQKKLYKMHEGKKRNK